MRCYCTCAWWIVVLLSKIESFKLCPLNCPTLLHVDKEAAERLSKTVDEACLLLAEYNGRLAAELEDRRQLARMLIEYTQNQKDVLTEKEKKLEVSTDYTGAGKPIVSPNAPSWLLICVFLSREMILGVIFTFGVKRVRRRCKKSGEDKSVLMFSLVCFNTCGHERPRTQYFLKKNRLT